MICLSQASLIRGGRSVLHAIDLSFEPGRLISLCGPNGAGKSSLLSLCAGDLPPSSGEVRLFERSPAHCPADELARLRAVMPQNPALDHPFRVADVVALGAPATAMGEREGILDELGCASLLTRIYTELSGGERRLVQLARVLLQAERAARSGLKPWLLLDEPVSQLDLGRSHEVMTAIAKRSAQGLGVIAVMHDLELASRHAERLLVLAQGRIIADGDPVTALSSDSIARAWEIEARIEVEAPGPGVRVRVLRTSSRPSAAD